MSNNITQYHGDCREILPTLEAGSVHCCVTSPPYYGLRDYGVDGQIGLEKTPDEFVLKLVKVFREVRRVLRDDGTLWLNLGDSYAANRSYQVSDGKHQSHDFGKSNASKIPNGLKQKDLIGIPWRVAFSLQADGWYLRQDIIWNKPNPMPESVRDRCTKSHEYIFLFSKSPRYYYDHEAIKEPAVCGDHPRNVDSLYSAPGQATHLGLRKKSLKVRPSAAKGSFNGKTEAMANTGQNAFRAVIETRNRRSVWTVATQPYSGSHFAVFPEKLIEPCVLAGCPEGGTVLDIFGGSGTTARVAIKNRRKAILIELNESYVELQNDRTRNVQVSLF